MRGRREGSGGVRGGMGGAFGGDGKVAAEAATPVGVLCRGKKRWPRRGRAGQFPACSSATCFTGRTSGVVAPRLYPKIRGEKWKTLGGAKALVGRRGLCVPCGAEAWICAQKGRWGLSARTARRSGDEKSVGWFIGDVDGVQHGWRCGGPIMGGQEGYWRGGRATRCARLAAALRILRVRPTVC